VKIHRLVLNKVGPFEKLDLVFPAGADPTRADVHLLVGPNGTGKSTVLSAIAQCFTLETATGFRERASGRESFAAVESDEGWFGVRPFAADEIVLPDGSRLRPFEQQPMWFFGRDAPNALYRSTWDWTRLRTDQSVRHVLFAFGGLRRVGRLQAPGLREIDDNPLAGASNLVREGPGTQFVQWLANTLADAAVSRDKGQTSRARDRQAALDRVADGLARVVGAPVRFELEFRPEFQVLVAVGAAPPVRIEQLPDGLQALVSWLGDLLMRLDRIPWAEPGPVTDREFVLLLDEVEVHMHPSWQRQVLPMAESLFPKAQIICSTHSPFVVGSASDASIHRFRLVDGRAGVDPPQPSALGSSISTVLDDVLGIRDEFDPDSQARLARFRELWRTRLAGDASVQGPLEQEAAVLRTRSLELSTIVETELRELRRRLTKAASA
jgi:predicted ATP-binding protein involved in virulence